jgi:hypothetical protein
MKNSLGAMMALALAATSLSPGAAYAHDTRHYGRDHYSYDHDRRRGNGDAVAAGVAGLVFGAILGAAVSNQHRRHRCDNGCGYYNDDAYDGGGYYNGNGYDGGNGYYGRPPALCVTRERRWDPYDGREVIIEERRPC